MKLVQTLLVLATLPITLPFFIMAFAFAGPFTSHVVEAWGNFSNSNIPPLRLLLSLVGYGIAIPLMGCNTLQRICIGAATIILLPVIMLAIILAITAFFVRVIWETV